MSKEDCIFCKIIAGDMPSEIVYEDDQVVAFLDINPTRPGHTLVVPREHTQDFISTQPELLGQVIKSVHKAAAKVMKGTGSDGFALMALNGPAAGQEVFHLHFHVIPRSHGDGTRMGWTKIKYHEGEMAIVAQKIREAEA